MDDHNVEQYRQPWESEDHWKLRKEFILKYKDQFPEYTLIALSQVHSDTELHGKSFPVPVILPDSQEYQQVTEGNEEGDLQLSEEEKQNDSELFAEEEQKDTTKQDIAEIFGEEGEDEQEDLEMFVEVLEEDHDDPETLDEKYYRNDSETSYGQFIQRDRLQDETVQNYSKSTSRNRHSACLQSSDERDIQFDALSESSNDECSTQANVQHSDSSAENSSGALPESLKENLVAVFQFVRKLHVEKLNASQVLDKLAKQFNVKVECLSEELRKAKCVHVCSVMVDGVSISMAKAPTKKSARRQAVNLAVARLMNINWLLVKANFSFSKLSEIVCATKQNSSQESGGMAVESPIFQAVEFRAIPEKSEDETGWNSSQDIQTSDGNMFESSSGQNEFQYDFYGNLEGQNCAMQSSYARSEESSSSEKVIQGMLPRNFKDNFVEVFQYIKQLHDEKLNGLQILEKVSKRFNAKIEFNCAVFTHAKSVHHCTVEIDGVLISRGKGLTKKNARRDAGKLAIDRLMQLLTRAKLSFSYRSKLLSSTDMNSLDMLGNLNRSETMPRSVGTSNVMYENYSCENKFDGNKTRHSSSDSTMRSSKSMQSVNFYALDTLPTPLKAKFRQISQFVRKSLAQKVNPVSILNNMSQKFKLGVKFRVKEHHFLSHECFLYIDGKVFTQAEALSEREARFNAAKLAVDRLMEISDKARNVNSGKDDASVNAFVASPDHNVTPSKNGWFASSNGTGIISSFGRDASVSYPSKSSVTHDPVVDAYKNSSWLLNVIKYNCTVNPETTLYAARNSGLTRVSQSGSVRQDMNAMNVFNEMNQNANRRSDNENLSRFMVDYPRQNLSVRSSYPAQSAESGYMRSNLLSSTERSDIPRRVDRCDLPDRAEKYDLQPWEERFNVPDRTKRFDLSNRTERFDLPNNRTERFDLPNNRTERFDLPNSRTERFDVPDRRERFDLPSNKMETFNVPNRTERFNLPNRAERFDVPRKSEQYNLPVSAERGHLPTEMNSHQSWVKDDGPKVWLHEL